jgi:hypothetical protein
MTAGPITRDRLSRDSTVLFLIDYQIGPLWEPDAAHLRREIVALAKVATTLGVPTILTAVAADDWGPIIPELTRVTPGAAVIQRSVLDPWSVSRVRDAIGATGRTHLVIAGVATEMGVARAALGATGDGYRVVALLDASGHFRSRAAAAAVLCMRTGGVIISNFATVLIELVNGNTEREACELLAIALRHTLPRPPAVSTTRAVRRQGRDEAGPAHPHIRTLRLERARRLLEQPGASLSDIALRTGCADKAHFTRLFKRQFGVTPGAILRAHARWRAG